MICAMLILPQTRPSAIPGWRCARAREERVIRAECWDPETDAAVPWSVTTRWEHDREGVLCRRIMTISAAASSRSACGACRTGRRGAQADWIVCQLRKFQQLAWLVPMRPQPWSLAGLTAGPGSELNFALVPYHPSERARGTR
jgi:hypothetical protein